LSCGSADNPTTAIFCNPHGARRIKVLRGNHCHAIVSLHFPEPGEIAMTAQFNRIQESPRRFGVVFAVIALLIVAALAIQQVVSRPMIMSKALAAEPPSTKIEDVPVPAPALTGIKAWENSSGLTLADLKGKVVVLHFWTFGCVNCQRNLPVYNRWQKDFAAKGIVILGVHTPETEDETKKENVAEQVKKREIKYPVAVDTEGASWRAYGNRYWPAIYLIDRRGKIRFRWDGELESNNAHGDFIIRKKIDALLAEKP
jgi:peroxiredoxin